MERNTISCVVQGRSEIYYPGVQNGKATNNQYSGTLINTSAPSSPGLDCSYIFKNVPYKISFTFLGGCWHTTAFLRDISLTYRTHISFLNVKKICRRRLISVSVP